MLSGVCFDVLDPPSGKFEWKGSLVNIQEDKLESKAKGQKYGQRSEVW